MHPVAAVKQRAFMMVAYFGYLVAAFANVPPKGGVALAPVFGGRRIHHPDNDCPSSSATPAAGSPAVPHVFVSAAQPYRNGSETMAAFSRIVPVLSGCIGPLAVIRERPFSTLSCRWTKAAIGQEQTFVQVPQINGA